MTDIEWYKFVHNLVVFIIVGFICAICATPTVPFHTEPLDSTAVAGTYNGAATGLYYGTDLHNDELAARFDTSNFEPHGIRDEAIRRSLIRHRVGK